MADTLNSSGGSDPTVWRKCSTCKKSILLNSKYFVCSVSTCNGQRTGYVFCTIQCFEVHLPGARHKDAGAIEKVAPRTNIPSGADPTSSSARAGAASSAASSSGASNPSNSAGGAFNHSQNQQKAPARMLATAPSTARSSVSSSLPREVLIIASRLKDYVTARSDFNTSASVMDVLSDHVRIVVDRAIDNARAEGRKTVLDRDFDFLRKS